jgi:hypothetical protein
MKLFFNTMTAVGMFLALNTVAMAQPDFCAYYNNPHQCAKDPSGLCFWDAADQRCENRGPATLCNRVPTMNACVHSPGCFWDQDDQRCEDINTAPPVPAGCYTIKGAFMPHGTIRPAADGSGIVQCQNGQWQYLEYYGQQNDDCDECEEDDQESIFDVIGGIFQ